MQITEVRDGESIILKIEGRVDVNSSPQVQESILKGFKEVNQVVLDLNQCTYVSSAGLRALLVGQKTAAAQQGVLKLINVPEILMSVLRLSGFLKFLTVE